MHFLQSTLSKPASNAKSPEGKRVNKIQYCAKKNESEFREFRRTNYELSFQTKFWRNSGASFIVVPAKFRKLGDDSETKVRGMNRNLVAKFRESFRKFRVINVTKFRFELSGISLRQTEISLLISS